MSIYKYILKSLLHYKKQHLAVFFAIVISTAVLTGALIVGDSVKFSLKSLVTKRLGSVTDAMVSGDRFVRAGLAKDIQKQTQSPSSAVLMLQGISINQNENIRINKTNILGIDSSFWSISSIKPFFLLGNEAVLGQNAAEKLNLKIGDEFLLRIANAQIIPLDAPFVSDEETDLSIRLKVKYIANDDQLGRFSLKNDQKAPYNVFVDREFISDEMNFADLVNLILVADEETNTENLNEVLHKVWTLGDASLKIRELSSEGDFELISERIFIDKQISDKIDSLKLNNTNYLSYLVNFIEFGEKNTPYSFVSASNAFAELKANEVIINQWLADDLGARVGDSLNLKYFVIGKLKKLHESESKFVVKEIVSNENEQIDSLLMPDFPGITESSSCRDWETGIPIDLTKIRDKDEDYWNKFRGKPKAIISLKMGLDLWKNEFGNYTNIRFRESEITKRKFEKEILSQLQPQALNLKFVSVKQKGDNAANNGVDFGGLFLSLSFFVIAAALILLIIILKFNTETRAKEFGVLRSLGFSRKQIVGLQFAEILLLTFFASLVGAFVGILYNEILLFALNSVWYDAVKTNMLEMFVQTKSLLIGALSGFILSILVVYWVIKNSLRKTIVGQIFATINGKKQVRKQIVQKSLFYFSLFLSIALLIYALSLPLETNSSLFLSLGFLVLVSLSLGFNEFLNLISAKAKPLNLDLYALAFKNISRNKSRSISVLFLLALGTFTIVVTASNRKTFSDSEKQIYSGTGGFLFWGETSIPLLYNLNSPQGKAEYNLSSADNLEYFQFYKLEGDDASCLNLNQVNNPAILGVNAESLNHRGAFSFAQFIENKEVSWLELENDYGENVIPAFADQTVITWGLIKSIGDTLHYSNEKGQLLDIVLVGGLNASVFQGHLLISQKNFERNFPSVSGSKVMLIDGQLEEKQQIAHEINAKLIDLGIELTETSSLLSEFYSVTNTYLTVFMMLGSLGVLLATLGMGIVILRTILERKFEFGLLLALGFGEKKVQNLLLIENVFLLFIGILFGVIAGFVAILPSVFTSSFSASWMFVLVILSVIFFNAVFWIYWASQKASKGSFSQNLRLE